MADWKTASGKATSPEHFKQLMEAGKGSDPRPLSVSKDEFARRWEKIFGKKEKS